MMRSMSGHKIAVRFSLIRTSSGSNLESRWRKKRCNDRINLLSVIVKKIMTSTHVSLDVDSTQLLQLVSDVVMDRKHIYIYIYTYIHIYIITYILSYITVL